MRLQETQVNEEKWHSPNILYHTPLNNEFIGAPGSNETCEIDYNGLCCQCLGVYYSVGSRQGEINKDKSSIFSPSDCKFTQKQLNSPKRCNKQNNVALQWTALTNSTQI